MSFVRISLFEERKTYKEIASRHTWLLHGTHGMVCTPYHNLPYKRTLFNLPPSPCLAHEPLNPVICKGVDRRERVGGDGIERKRWGREREAKRD